MWRTNEYLCIIHLTASWLQTTVVIGNESAMLACCCYLSFCPNRNLQLSVKIVRSKNSNFRFTASLVYHFQGTRRLEQWRFQERPHPVPNLLPQLRVQASELNDLLSDGWLQEAAALLPLPLAILLVSNSYRWRRSSYCFRLNLFEVKHLKHQAPHIRFAIHAVCKTM
jgi:hypothetical protein